MTRYAGLKKNEVYKPKNDKSKICRVEIIRESGNFVQIFNAPIFCTAKFGKQFAATNILDKKFNF